MKFPLLMDGGLSNALEERGAALHPTLWTAGLIDKVPETIKAVHQDYLQAGASIISTTSYQGSIVGFQEAGYSKDQALTLLNQSVTLGQQAIQVYRAASQTDRPLWLAASIGPYGAYLADGSEYSGQYGLSKEALAVFHQERIQWLDQSSADLLAFETIPSFLEVQVLGELLEHVQKPAWISVSCKDSSHLSDGSPIEQSLEYLKDHPNVFAFGVNCTAPAHISELIRRIQSTQPSQKIMVYPNSGEIYDATEKSWSGGHIGGIPEDWIREWLDLGLDILGGCCRIGPAEISKMNQILKTYQ